MSAPTRKLLAIGFSALALIFPLVAANEYYVYVLALAYIMAIAAIGLNLLLGYTGQLNLAHAGFMAIGAYTLGILTVDHDVPYWIAFTLAGVVSSLFGAVAGVISLRLKGHFFSIFTLCVGFIIFLVIEKWDDLTHGVIGLIGIPVPPGLGPVQFNTTTGQYYLVLAFLLLSLFVMQRIMESLLGRAFMAIRNSEGLAEALGVRLMWTKLIAFMISTFYAGIAGALYAGFVRFLGPNVAATDHTFDLIAYILVGGIGTLFGPLLGAVMLTALTQSLQFLQDYRMIVFGPLLIALVTFFPQGILGSLRQRRAKAARPTPKRSSSPPPLDAPTRLKASADA